ncbi:Uncharacterized UDP-glucosyltransferase YdhE [Durusdinium trenchii]|uniref:Uncharacterized UDP-glucosyltransferase YdhE n=1 Tax=Durusdinium trenchii TaxID=1381693 RepID=A0ABP0RLV4_9DINO
MMTMLEDDLCDPSMIEESGWVIVKGAVSERTAAQGDWRVLPHLSSKERVLLRLRRRLRCRGLRGIGTHAGRGKVPEAEATGVGWKTRIGFEVDFWPKKMWAQPDFKCTFVRYGAIESLQEEHGMTNESLSKGRLMLHELAVELKLPGTLRWLREICADLVVCCPIVNLEAPLAAKVVQVPCVPLLTTAGPGSAKLFWENILRALGLTAEELLEERSQFQGLFDCLARLKRVYGLELHVEDTLKPLGLLRSCLLSQMTLVTTLDFLADPCPAELREAYAGHHFSYVGPLLDRPGAKRVSNFKVDAVNAAAVCAQRTKKEELTPFLEQRAMALAEAARADGRAIVLVSLGTIITGDHSDYGWNAHFTVDGEKRGISGKELCHAAWQGVFDVFGTGEALVLLAQGPQADALEALEIPANVFCSPTLPQVDLLRLGVELFLTHGGQNSFMEALSQGCPLVVCPGFADQPVNAAKAEALGIGLKVDRPMGPLEEAADAIARYRSATAGALRKVKSEPSFKEMAMKYAASFSATDGVSLAVHALLQLADAHSSRLGGGRLEGEVSAVSVSRSRYLPVTCKEDAWKRGMGLRAQLLDTYLQKRAVHIDHCLVCQRAGAGPPSNWAIHLVAPTHFKEIGKLCAENVDIDGVIRDWSQEWQIPRGRVKFNYIDGSIWMCKGTASGAPTGIWGQQAATSAPMPPISSAGHVPAMCPANTSSSPATSGPCCAARGRAGSLIDLCPKPDTWYVYREHVGIPTLRGGDYSTCQWLQSKGNWKRAMQDAVNALHPILEQYQIYPDCKFCPSAGDFCGHLPASKHFTHLSDRLRPNIDIVKVATDRDWTEEWLVPGGAVRWFHITGAIMILKGNPSAAPRDKWSKLPSVDASALPAPPHPPAPAPAPYPALPAPQSISEAEFFWRNRLESDPVEIEATLARLPVRPEDLGCSICRIGFENLAQFRQHLESVEHFKRLSLEAGYPQQVKVNQNRMMQNFQNRNGQRMMLNHFTLKLEAPGTLSQPAQQVPRVRTESQIGSTGSSVSEAY